MSKRLMLALLIAISFSSFAQADSAYNCMQVPNDSIPSIFVS
jgi:hypothetical protein